MSANMKKRRPSADDYESYEEFYEAVYRYLLKRNEQAEYDPTIHIEEGNELVRICPHCEAPAIISIMSPASSPSWRCVGKGQLSDRHQFNTENIPEDRLEAEANPLLEDIRSGEEDDEEADEEEKTKEEAEAAD